ncbi:hypothetical protein Syun_005511 [Stephania yunnanensis]|uniref:Uncharacterized protein n=1 Tax=Stephania yunnanensis TaxID=152371 RepID=A0AAP0L903_9MAGN
MLRVCPPGSQIGTSKIISIRKERLFHVGWLWSLEPASPEVLPLRCIKHLNQSVLEGRYITVEKEETSEDANTGHYLGLKSTRDSVSYRGDRSRRGGYGVMTMDIVGLQGDRHIEEVVIFLLDVHLIEVGQEGSDLGQFPILLMVARKGAMDGVLMCMQGENAL